jgi:excisionase family DNA binding protein
VRDSDLTGRARGPQSTGRRERSEAAGTVRQTDRLIPVEEAAQLLAVTPAAIRKWLTQRRLHRVKVGAATRLRLSDIEAVMAGGLLERIARM